MGLETATYINGLVVSNPAGGDDRSQGDDHIRLIKSAIKNTFPNIDGAMTLTEDVINALPTSKANLASPTFTGVPAGPTAAPGTNTTQLATTAFIKAALNTGEGQLIAGNGWVKLPGGIILQWGSRDCQFAAAIRVSAVTYPIPFPTATLQTFSTFNSSEVQTAVLVLGTSDQTTTGFNINTFCNNAFTRSVAWFAIGY